MPTRNQIRNATPRCPGIKTNTGNHWTECGRLLVWNHNHGAWLCEKHGVINQASQHAQATA